MMIINEGRKMRWKIVRQLNKAFCFLNEIRLQKAQNKITNYTIVCD